MQKNFLPPQQHKEHNFKQLLNLQKVIKFDDQKTGKTSILKYIAGSTVNVFSIKQSNNKSNKNYQDCSFRVHKVFSLVNSALGHTCHENNPK